MCNKKLLLVKIITLGYKFQWCDSNK